MILRGRCSESGDSVILSYYPIEPRSRSCSQPRCAAASACGRRARPGAPAAQLGDPAWAVPPAGGPCLTRTRPRLRRRCRLTGSHHGRRRRRGGRDRASRTVTRATLGSAAVTLAVTVPVPRTSQTRPRLSTVMSGGVYRDSVNVYSVVLALMVRPVPSRSAERRECRHVRGRPGPGGRPVGTVMSDTGVITVTAASLSASHDEPPTSPAVPLPGPPLAPAGSADSDSDLDSNGLNLNPMFSGGRRGCHWSRCCGVT